MSRNVNDEPENEEKVIRYNNDQDQFESIDTAGRLKKTIDKEPNEQKYDEEEKEEKLDRNRFINEILKKSPYKNIFDEEYMKFFENKKNLEFFDEAIKEMTDLNYINYQESTINKLRKNIEESVIDYFNINIIRIYLDLKKLYNKFKRYNTFDEKFLEEFENEQDIKDFDKLYANIRTNLFKKAKEYLIFSKVFFRNLDTKILHFFIRIYMARIFISIKNNEKANMSIIDEKNYLIREILLNIIKNIIYQKKLYSDLKNEKSGDISKEEKIKKYEDIFIGYFDILIDFIFFQSAFILDEQNINENKTIYENYISYHGKLSVFNNDIYSAIYEPNFENKTKNPIYKKWNEYIKDEYNNKGLHVLFKILDHMDKFYDVKKTLEDNKKENNEEQKLHGNFRKKFHRRVFYDLIFEILDKKIVNFKEANKNHLKYVNAIIKLILYEGNRHNIFKIFEKSTQREDIKKRRKQTFLSIITKIINNIQCIGILKENIEAEYVNSLIILLESFGEYKNEYLSDIMYKTNEQENQGLTFLEKLIGIFRQLLGEDNKNEHILYNDKQKNKLILINSLTRCIVEYIENSNINDKIYKINIEAHIDDDLLIMDSYYKIIDFPNIENLYYHLFSLENYLFYEVNLLKNLNIKDESYKELMNINENSSETVLICLNSCFKKFLHLINLYLSYDKSSNQINLVRGGKSRKEKEKIEYITYSLFVDENKNNNNYDYEYIDYKQLDISQAVNELLNKYKNYEFTSFKNEKLNQVINGLLSLIFLNYKKLFYLNELSKIGFEYFLYINDNINNFIKANELFDFYYARKNNMRNRLVVLFSFLQEICDIIEIKAEDLKNNNANEIIKTDVIKEINFLNPEYLVLPEHSVYYFENQIDYSERETKLMSIYNFIECIIYDIKTTQKTNGSRNCFDKFIKFVNENLFFYYILEIINIIFFIVENVLLVIYYRKSRSEIEEIYNEIDNRKDFDSVDILRIIHIIYLAIIIIQWLIFRAKIDFFYSIIKFTNENFKEREKLKMSEKAKLLKKDDFSFRDFLTKKENETIRKYFKYNCFKKLSNFIQKILHFLGSSEIIVCIFSLASIYPFILSLICLCLTYWSQIWFMFPLLLIFNIFESLREIFFSTIIMGQSSTLILLIIYILLILYIFSWIGFFFLPNMFKYEAVDKNNEIVSPNNLEENICSSSVPCILYFMNFGLSSEGSIEMNLISFKRNTSYYLIQFFFQIILYVFIHMIFFNVVLAMIGNAFDQMIEKVDKKKDDEKNVCFICDKTRNDCISEHEDFDEHLKRHSKWKYIIYISNIILKSKEEFSIEEYYLWRQIKHKKLDWFPKYEKKNE